MESKLPGDVFRPQQIQGLNLIKKYLKVPHPVSVSIISLTPENSES